MTNTFTEISPVSSAAHDAATLREEVLRRMEVYVLQLLHTLLEPQITQRESCGAVRTDATEWTRRGLPGESEPLRRVTGALPDTRRRCCLKSAHHHLLLLTVLYPNVAQGRVATQRDVYYHLIRRVATQEAVNRTVQQLSGVLRLPRQLMGVTAGGRGFVAGCLAFHGQSLCGALPGSAGDEGVPLPLLEEDLVVSVRRGTGVQVPSTRGGGGERGFQVLPNVCAIVVVEKHAVFAQLLRQGLPRLLPCVLLTAQGFPSHAARRLLAHLHAALPRAAVVGLVDYNPHGLAILAAYRWASTSTAAPVASTCVESRYYAVPALRWLGVRTTHVTRILHECERSDAGSALPGASPTAPLAPFTPRDACVMQHLVQRLEALVQQDADATAAAAGCASGEAEAVTTATRARDGHGGRLVAADLDERASAASVSAWLAEARAMQQRGVKCELEALYTDPYADLFLSTAAAAARAQRPAGVRPPPSSTQAAEWVCQQLLRRRAV
ncbi:meiotic recombination protein SPO11 [Novymonas esmeraldas]|uniref:DNA topoisomerase (ATP-hydrolyzing) n=1 Tax=Novymonas esmeraldas TaxID=1808958 RepID=A0AAW0EIU9_9TRYP